MNNYWLSWYHPQELGFELHWPWWITGQGNNYVTICAAVQAEDEDAAKAIVQAAMDKPDKVEWRFCSLKAHGWAPFGDRLPHADWMEWPAEPFTNT